MPDKLTDVLNSYEKISLLTGLLITLIILFFYYLIASSHSHRTDIVDVPHTQEQENTKLATGTTTHMDLENDIHKLQSIEQEIMALKNDLAPYNHYLPASNSSSGSNSESASRAMLDKPSVSQSMPLVKLPRNHLPLVLVEIPTSPAKPETASDKLKTDDRIRHQSVKHIKTEQPKKTQTATKPVLSKVRKDKSVTKTASPPKKLARKQPDTLDSRKERQQAFLVLEQSLDSLHPH